MESEISRKPVVEIIVRAVLTTMDAQLTRSKWSLRREQLGPTSTAPGCLAASKGVSFTFIHIAYRAQELMVKNILTTHSSKLFVKIRVT